MGKRFQPPCHQGHRALLLQRHKHHVGITLRELANVRCRSEDVQTLPGPRAQQDHHLRTLHQGNSHATFNGLCGRSGDAVQQRWWGE